MFKTFAEILNASAAKGPKMIAVAVAQDEAVLTAIDNAKAKGIVNAILIGNEEEIEKTAQNCNINLGNYQIINIEDKVEACRRAVELVSTGKAQLLMKGLVDTSILLKAVLDENIGLRTDNVLSHVAVFNVPDYERLLYITDSAMNIAPELEQKKQIINNAVTVAHALGNAKPLVAVLSAIEKVNPKMQATLDAVELVRMYEEGKITGCVVGGPFALDNAISDEAAKHKNIIHPVAGWADILVVPTIEAGNMLYKSMVYFAKAKNAGIIVGAKAPIVLTSRADSEETKLNSIALGVLMASA